MAILNVNTDEVVRYSNKLEKLHRSAFPVAIRGALNNAAFDVKQKTMPASAGKEFVNRNPNFFKANSKVLMAKGFNVRTMEATIGFITDKLKGSNQAVEDLEQQEHGGKIKGRAFIPLDVARGGSNTRPVRPSNRLTRITNIVNARKVRGKTRQQKFVKAAMAAGAGGYVIGNFTPKILWKITGIKKIGGKLKIKKVPVYSYEKGRDVNVSATNFMKKATLKTAKKLEGFYIIQAKKQIEKALLK